MAQRNDKVEQIELCATDLLATCTVDYAPRVWDSIGDEVIADVLKCTDGEDGFTRSEVCLAIGRALLGCMGQGV